MNKESIEFMEEFCDFSNPSYVWIMTGLSRNKDNPFNYHEFFSRYIIGSVEDIASCYVSLKNNMTDNETIYRIYISLNARDTIKTLFSYQIKLCTLSKAVCFNHNADQVNKLDSLWKTELSQNANRGTRRILLDIDGDYSIEKINALVDAIKGFCTTNIYCIRKTINGYALVMDACYTGELLEYAKKENITMDIKNDSMVFVERYLKE